MNSSVGTLGLKRITLEVLNVHLRREKKGKEKLGESLCLGIYRGTNGGMLS